MNKKENEKDYLTGLYNYQYLIDNYQTIIQEKDNYYLIVIDFKNFKYINDNFGHEVGDKGLVVFSEAAKKVFKNDFVIRRSGDEFIVVTKQPISKLNQKIDNIHDSINQAVLKKIIPIPFGFNSGLTKAEKDLEQALLKAEVAMYQAKSKRVRLVIFKDIYLKKLKEQEVYLNQIDEMLLNNQFDLKTQELYDLNHQKQNIFLIFVKDEKGRSVFKNKYYELLKNSFRIRKIEMQTLNIIYSSKLIKKEKTIINLDYQTLFGYQFDFANYVTKLAKKNSVNPSKVIFCININNYEGKTEELLKVLNKIKRKGFQLAISGVDFSQKSALIAIINNVEIAYINIPFNLAKNSLLDHKQKIVLEHLIDLMNSFKIKLIITRIVNLDNLKLVKKITKDSLVMGRLFSEKRDLI